MFFLGGKTSGFWLYAASRSQLRARAIELLPGRPLHILPQLDPAVEEALKTPFVPGAQPAVMVFYSDFVQKLYPFVSHDLKRGLSRSEFDKRLSSRFNAFNRIADLPPVLSCLPIDGRGHSSLSRGRYSFVDGGLSFHYQFDRRSFLAIVAHELTHLEQDYLAICYLADFLQIGETFDSEQLTQLSQLVESNRRMRPSNELLERFLRHRRGRALSADNSIRAQRILQSFRLQPYMQILLTESRKAQRLIPKRSWFRRTDYAAFWQSVCLNSGEIPAGLIPCYEEAKRHLDENPQDLKLISKQFLRLLTHFQDEADARNQTLLTLWQRYCYFEREAYEVTRLYQLEESA